MRIMRVLLSTLMRSNPEFFSQFNVKISDTVLDPKWHFTMLSKLGIVTESDLPYSDKNPFFMNERIPLHMAFYRLGKTISTFNYKRCRMFTVTVNEPENICNIIHESISPRIKIETFGKYGCRYFMGDLFALLHADLFAHIREETWHPDRCFKWCFAYDNCSIDYEKYENV